MKKTFLMLMAAMGAAGAWAVEPLKDLTAIQIADSQAAWLDVRNAKTYELEDTIPVSHSASNWVNAAAQPGDEAAVTWAWNEDGQDSKSCTDDAPLTVTLKSLGKYEFTHTASDGSSVSTNITVVKRQLGTEAEPWIISKEDDPCGEVRAFMLSETELCIEGEGVTMVNFGGCGPWGENIRSVYFADSFPEISTNAFLGCTNLCAVMAENGVVAGMLVIKLRDSGFFDQPGVDESQVSPVGLEDMWPVECLSVTKVNGRVEIRCVVYDEDAASTSCGSNVKLGLSVSIMGEEKEVKHLHRVENGGIEYDDMMLWLKKDGRPKFVTLIWDAELDLTPEELAELDFDNILVNGTNCADALVTVRNGEFVGVLDEETKVRAWKGIPYATQPTGTNRWRRVGDPAPSSGTFAAKQFGHAAIQMLDPSETGGYIEQGDDCLVLNVWSTDKEKDVGYDYGKRPVMVYIHGGAFVMGGTADIHYDGRNIVERHEDVVVVTINYRVGLLGFADLKNVPDGANFRDAQNLGILDQRQALKWVRDNIAAFGGDPGNVTIFGESAGGGSVAIHMTSPESKDLFRRAIQMSGSLDLSLTEKAYDERRLVPELVAAVAKLRFGDVSKTNYVDMAVLQSLTVGEIRNLLQTPVGEPNSVYPDGLPWPAWDMPSDDISGGVCVLNSFMNFPICDDERGIVPTDPFKAFKESGVANGKDYMVGTVRHEMRYFTGYDGPDDPLRTYYTGLIADRMRLNKVWFGEDNEDLIHDFIDACEDDGVRDEMDTRYPGIWKMTALEDQLYMRLPAIKMADIHAMLPADSESGYKGKTYMYRFDKGREHAYEPWAGAGHACELDYVFHNTSIVEAGPIDENLADAVCDAFVNFARTGDPNDEKSEEGGAKSEATWKEYEATDVQDLDSRKTLLFQNDCTTACVSDPDKFARVKFLKSGAWDTYREARANTACRTTINVPFVRDESSLPTGTADKPWQVGRTAGDEVIAYMNEVGKLFVEVREDEGDIRDFYALGGGLWFGEGTVEAEFGAGVKGIGANMLSTCSNLRTIVMYAEEPPELGKDALPAAWQLEEIVVPEGCGDDYRKAWPEYEDVIMEAVPGSKEMPWKVGATASDTLAAYADGTGRLEIIGDGPMKGFQVQAPWAGNALTEIVAGAGVGSFGANAFANCAGLETLVVYAAVPPALGAGNNLAGVKIFVPAGTADAYRAAWPAYAGQIDEMRSAKGEPLTKQLYEMTYTWWDAAKANDIGEKLAAIIEAGEWMKEMEDCFFPYVFFDWYKGLANRALCTSCRNGDFIGRNFDWGYDDVDECVLHIPAAEGRLSSVGVASWFFPKDLQDAFDVDEFLPELTMDGVNEKGVAINVNVVPGGDNGWTTGTKDGAKRLCAGFAVRTVLDNATSAAHAVKILQSRDIYSLKPLEFHWMISDATESYIVECAQNQLVVLKAKDARPKMSNYYVSYSPSVGEYDVVSDNEELTEDEHTPHAMGIERYANVSNGLESVDSVEAMFTRMTNVWYKAKYLPGNEEKFWSDLNGAPIPDGGTTATSQQRFEFNDGLDEARSNAFKQIQANYVAVTNYEARWKSRDTLEHDPTLTNGVVHTVHTSIYDLEKRELTVCVQEDAGMVRTFDLFGPVVPGSEANPWKVGTEGHEAEVTAWTNGMGTLVIEGAGAVGSMPWAENPAGIDELIRAKGVTGKLETLVGSLPDLTMVNGLTREEFSSAALGFVRTDGFSAIEVENGRAYLDVVVGRSDSLGASAEWAPVSTNTVEVPAPGEQGFFIVSPLFYIPGTDYTITGGVEDPFKHRHTR